MIKILLVDDHPVVREGLVRMLSSEADFEVVAEAGSGSEAKTLYEQHRPDVTIMDLSMADMEGDEVIRQIKKNHPEARFLVLTAFDTDDRIRGAIHAGAQGYLLKGSPKESLFNAVRTVNDGGSILGPGVGDRLLGAVDALGRNPADELTDRELGILRLTANGMRNRDIAEELSISERTVKFHLTTVYQKLAVSSRTEAIREASRRGIIHI